MAKIFFRYGSMNSGKSALLAAVHYNYHERGMRALVIKPTIDTKSAKVVSRMGVEVEVDWPIDEQDSILSLYAGHRILSDEPIACLLVDEAQFLTPNQVDELLTIAVMHDTPVIAYGLRTDFQTRLFPGAQRLMEVAHALEELKTICFCGRKAIFNARSVNNEWVREGEQVAIDGTADYTALCGQCYLTLVGLPEANV